MSLDPLLHASPVIQIHAYVAIVALCSAPCSSSARKAIGSIA